MPTTGPGPTVDFDADVLAGVWLDFDADIAAPVVAGRVDLDFDTDVTTAGYPTGPGPVLDFDTQVAGYGPTLDIDTDISDEAATGVARYARRIGKRWPPA